MRLAALLVIAAIVSGLATYAALTEVPPFGTDPGTVIWLLNLDLVILLLLVTLIARRMARIWSAQRQGIAGSRLHVRLVVIFSIMAAAPAIIMAIFSAFFFHYGVQSWFSERVQTAVFESQAVAESYLEEHQQVIKADVLAMANDLDRQAGLFIDNPKGFSSLIETQSFMRNLTEVLLFNSAGQILARSGLSFTLSFESLPRYLLEEAQGGEVVLTTSGTEDRVRALVKLNNFEDAYLFVGRMVDPTVLAHLAATRDAANEYAQLQGSYSTLQIAVTMIFVVVALLLLLTAIWFALMLARQLVTPIGRMISVADQVSAGDLTARMTEKENIEEFDYLAKSFNRMTGQIQQQRDELVMANRQLDQRRRFTEAVLAGVSAGIVGVDENGVISLANSSAAALFEEDPAQMVGKNIVTLFPEVSDLLIQAHQRPEKVTQSEIPVTSEDGSRRTLLVRIAIEMIGNEDKGAVLTFDDITDLQAALRKAAWSGVARRIAHEIKNPLTPIQLSAERLKRKYLKEIKTDPHIFEKCTDTIIRHVEDIGRMVTEFSAFARMPEAVMKHENLAMHVRDMVVLQKEAHPDIEFNLKVFDEKSPLMADCDAAQIRQAFTNLILNAIDSVLARQEEAPPPKARIDIILSPLAEGEKLSLSIIDSGAGLPEGEDPAKLTEPYVTHKAKGTGLGLAIVKKIMEDHQGRLVIGTPDWVRDLSGWEDLGGATVSLVIPFEQDSKTPKNQQAA
ncbi:MAG: PAS domain-containing sensor histidine kinase [Rhodospirillales bacterium]|nr:PAS domain-containing sensor histidine kinase [Alphaproteobacteria bacterium]USO03343.1 MAG: PAS domain-containing sensor histidine kinase [Rhodospirillales bacterium]